MQHSVFRIRLLALARNRWFRRTLVFGAMLSLGCVALMLWAASVFRAEESEHQVEHALLPGGGILSNESHLSVGFLDSSRVNKLYLQAGRHSPREKVGEVIDELPAISLSGEIPLLLRHGRHLVIVVGRIIFFRRIGPTRGAWQQFSVSAVDSAVVPFLRSQQQRELNRSGDRPTPSHAPGEVYFFEAPDFYAFHRLNSAENTLVLRRRPAVDASFVEFLIFSAPLDDFPRYFDLQRTRTVNLLPTPPDPALWIEASLIEAPILDRFSAPRDRMGALARPRAREIFRQAQPLSAREWIALEFPPFISAHGGTADRFEARFGFSDPDPGVHSFQSRQGSSPFSRWTTARTGMWVSGATSSVNGHTRSVFVRLTDAPPASAAQTAP